MFLFFFVLETTFWSPAPFLCAVLAAIVSIRSPGQCMHSGSRELLVWRLHWPVRNDVLEHCRGNLQMLTKWFLCNKHHKNGVPCCTFSKKWKKVCSVQKGWFQQKLHKKATQWAATQPMGPKPRRRSDNDSVFTSVTPDRDRTSDLELFSGFSYKCDFSGSRTDAMPGNSDNI